MNFSLTTVAIFLITGVIGYESMASDIQVKLLYEQPESWSAAEKELIAKAAHLTFQRISTSEVANCAYRNTFRDRFSKDELRKRFREQIPVLNKGREITLTVTKESMSAHHLAVATVGSAKVNRQKYTVDDLRVTFNEDNLGKHAARYLKMQAKEAKVERFVNVIAHEVGHALGYSHGTASAQWDENYPGYFVTELGFCTMTDGKHGSDLGDAAVRRQRSKRFGKE